MVTHMVEQGVDARQDGTAYHSYAAIPRPGQEDILADGTWQQFLPPKRLQGDAVLPKVLVGTRAEVISAAHAYGVHEGDLGAWKAKDPEQSNNLRIVVPPLD